MRNIIIIYILFVLFIIVGCSKQPIQINEQQNDGNPTKNNTILNNQTKDAINIKPSTDGWLVYLNKNMKFSISHPVDWAIIQEPINLGDPLVIKQNNNSNNNCKISVWILPTRVGRGLNTISKLNTKVIINDTEFNKELLDEIENVTTELVYLETKNDITYYTISYYNSGVDNCSVTPENIVKTFNLGD
ncbi:MAG: hypothetical protein ABIE43_01415 [Patescibacteria group bacterium]